MTHVWHDALLSTFADPEDINAFARCKLTGKSDAECFEVGDNGIGCWGDDTTSLVEHFVALHADCLLERWGSLHNSKHRLVEVVVGDRKCIARVGDRCGVRDRCDANPAVQRTLGVTAGALRPCRWRWME